MTRLLHIDAFPSRPMHGRRILRFFANVAPDAPRHWRVGEPFEILRGCSCRAIAALIQEVLAWQVIAV